MFSLKQPNIVLRRGWRSFFRWRGSLGWFGGGDGAGEDFDLLFRVGQAVCARLNESHAFLVTGQKFFQGQLGVFHVGDDLFEAGEKILEFFRRISGIGGGREQSAGDHETIILPWPNRGVQPIRSAHALYPVIPSFPSCITHARLGTRGTRILLATLGEWRHDDFSLS